MPGPRNERELKRMSKLVAGLRKDKDRARRKRRLSGTVAPPQRKPTRRPAPDAADDWDDELAPED